MIEGILGSGQFFYYNTVMFAAKVAISTKQELQLQLLVLEIILVRL